MKSNTNRRQFLQTAGAAAGAAIPPGFWPATPRAVNPSDADRKTTAASSAKKARVLERKSKATLTPIGLNHGETLRFVLRDGRPWEMTLLATSAEVIRRHSARRGRLDPNHESGDIAAYAFDCDVRINGTAHHLRREVATQASFYEPWEVDGVRLWFDAVSCAFKEDGGFMAEKDWRGGLLCKPFHKARFAVHEADLPICPEPMLPWYPTTPVA
ncbi:MAG: twin-arginine translocation signal domain-containing protein [Candidatus Sumerlaeia bacterium]|nr:twin-arginine translocation signal domain-containing protein [Candidatus Sumerlaeia bacterium]